MLNGLFYRLLMRIRFHFLRSGIVDLYKTTTTKISNWTLTFPPYVYITTPPPTVYNLAFGVQILDVLKVTQLNKEQSVAIKTNAYLSEMIEGRRSVLFGRLDDVYVKNEMDATCVQALIAAAVDDDPSDLYRGWKHSWFRKTGERVETTELQSTMEMDEFEAEWGMNDAWNDYAPHPDSNNSMLDMVSRLSDLCNVNLPVSVYICELGFAFNGCERL